MAHSRRTLWMVSVAGIAIIAGLSACTPSNNRIEPPNGGALETIEDGAAVDADRLMRIAHATEASGNLARAAAMYQRASTLAPEANEPLLALASAYQRLGVPENAAKAYRTVLARVPDNRDARRGLGNALVALDQPGEALDQFDRLIAAEPLDHRAYNGRGVSLDMLDRHEEAWTSYEIGLKLAPNNVELSNNLALSLTMAGRADEAIPILKRLSTGDNVSDKVRRNLALAESRASGGKTDVTNLEAPASTASQTGARRDAARRERGDSRVPLPVVSSPDGELRPEDTSRAPDQKPAAKAPSHSEPLAYSEDPDIDAQYSSAEPAPVRLSSDVKSATKTPRTTTHASIDAAPIKSRATSGPVVAASRPTSAEDVPVSISEIKPAAGGNAGGMPRSDADASKNGPAAATQLTAKDTGSVSRASEPRTTASKTPGKFAALQQALTAAVKPAAGTSTDVAAGNRAAKSPPPQTSGLATGREAVASRRPNLLALAQPSTESIGKPSSTLQAAAAQTTTPVGITGTYHVHLAAEQTHEFALETWRSLVAKAPDLLGAYQPSISSPSVLKEGAKLPFRLRVDQAMPRSTAEALCNGLKGRGIDCFVIAAGRRAGTASERQAANLPAATVSNATPNDIAPAAGLIEPSMPRKPRSPGPAMF